MPSHRGDVGRRFGLTIGPDRGLDEIHAYPQGVMRVGDELARRADRRGVVVRLFELAAPDCRQATSVAGELGDHVGAVPLGPVRDDVGQLAHERVVAARRGDEGPVVAQHRHVQPQAGVLADLEAFRQQLLQLVPLARQEVVQAQSVQRGDDLDRTRPSPRAVHHAPDGGPAAAEAVDEHGSQRDLAKVPRVGLVVEVGDDLIEAIEHRDGVADWIGHRPAGQQQVLGDTRPETIEDREVGGPQLGAAGEAADEEQQVDGRPQILVRRVELVALGLDRSHQQPMDRVEVAVTVEEHESGGHIGLARGARPGTGAQRRSDDALDVVEAPRHVYADERRLGQPAAPVAVERAQLRRSGQCRRRSHRVTAIEQLPRCGLEHLRHPLIRLDSRLGEMPRLTLWLVRPNLGQGPVCLAPLLRGRALDDRGAGQGVAEDQPASLRIDTYELDSLGGGEVLQLGVSGCPLQRTQVARVVQSDEEEQAPRRGW